MIRPLATCAVLLLATLWPLHARVEPAAPAAEVATIDLVPKDAPKWSPNNLFAPITGFFYGGPGYWYDRRVVEIETTPPGAVLDLFYVRRNFQKRYEQSDAPTRVILCAGAGTFERALDFAFVVRLNQRRETQLARGREEFAQLGIREDSHDQQRRVCADRARLVELVGVNDEVGVLGRKEQDAVGRLPTDAGQGEKVPAQVGGGDVPAQVVFDGSVAAVGQRTGDRDEAAGLRRGERHTADRLSHGLRVGGR